MAAIEVMGWPTSHRLLPVDRPTRRCAGLFRKECPSPLCQEPPASSCSRSTCAARSAASWVSGSLRTAERTSAAVARLAPTGGPVSAATRSATVASSSAAGTTRVASPIGLRLGGAHRAAGQADLHGAGVADQLDQSAGAGQIGHQAERRLGQPQLGVVGQDPQVAGERELAAGADRVPLHRGDRDDAR